MCLFRPRRATEGHLVEWGSEEAGARPAKRWSQAGSAGAHDQHRHV